RVNFPIMDSPASKSALLVAMRSGRADWDALLARIPVAALDEPGVEGVWSVRQIVAHISGYEAYCAAFLIDRRDPGARALQMHDAFWQAELDAYCHNVPDFPARLADTDDDQTNAVVVATLDRLTTAEVITRERQDYQRLLAAVEALTEQELAQPWAPGSRSILAILPGQCYAHYATHTPAIKHWLTQR